MLHYFEIRDFTISKHAYAGEVPLAQLYIYAS